MTTDSTGESSLSIGGFEKQRENELNPSTRISSGQDSLILIDQTTISHFTTSEDGVKSQTVVDLDSKIQDASIGLGNNVFVVKNSELWSYPVAGSSNRELFTDVQQVESLDQKALAVVITTDGTVRLVDAESGIVRTEDRPFSGEKAISIVTGPDRYLVFSDSKFVAYDDRGKPLYADSTDAPIQCAGILRNQLVFGLGDNSVAIFDIEDKEQNDTYNRPLVRITHSTDRYLLGLTERGVVIIEPDGAFRRISDIEIDDIMLTYSRNLLALIREEQISFHTPIEPTAEIERSENDEGYSLQIEITNPREIPLEWRVTCDDSVEDTFFVPAGGSQTETIDLPTEIEDTFECLIEDLIKEQPICSKRFDLGVSDSTAVLDDSKAETSIESQERESEQRITEEVNAQDCVPTEKSESTVSSNIPSQSETKEETGPRDIGSSGASGDGELHFRPTLDWGMPITLDISIQRIVNGSATTQISVVNESDTTLEISLEPRLDTGDSSSDIVFNILEPEQKDKQDAELPIKGNTIDFRLQWQAVGPSKNKSGQETIELSFPEPIINYSTKIRETESITRRHRLEININNRLRVPIEDEITIKTKKDRGHIHAISSIPDTVPATGELIYITEDTMLTSGDEKFAVFIQFKHLDASIQEKSVVYIDHEGEKGPVPEIRRQLFKPGSGEKIQIRDSESTEGTISPHLTIEERLIVKNTGTEEMKETHLMLGGEDGSKGELGRVEPGSAKELYRYHQINDDTEIQFPEVRVQSLNTGKKYQASRASCNTPNLRIVGRLIEISNERYLVLGIKNESSNQQEINSIQLDSSEFRTATSYSVERSIDVGEVQSCVVSLKDLDTNHIPRVATCNVNDGYFDETYSIILSETDAQKIFKFNQWWDVALYPGEENALQLRISNATDENISNITISLNNSLFEITCDSISPGEGISTIITPDILDVGGMLEISGTTTDGTTRCREFVIDQSDGKISPIPTAQEVDQDVIVENRDAIETTSWDIR